MRRSNRECVGTVYERIALRFACALSLWLLTSNMPAQDWSQWARSSRHDGAATVSGKRLQTTDAVLVIDPFADLEIQGNYLPVLYPTALLDGNDLFIIQKSGTYSPSTRATQFWSIRNLRRDNAYVTDRWTVQTDWRPLPGRYLETPYQCSLTHDYVWAPGLGGTMLRIRRVDGVTERINPFGTGVDSTMFVAGSAAIDDFGNLYYNVIQLDPAHPWSADVLGAWLVRIGADEVVTKAPFASLVSAAPSATDLCTTFFDSTQLPFPPSKDAAAPTAPCGSQRPALNSTPAIGEDGTVFAISRAHFNDRWGYIVAVNPNLTPRWTASLRNRLSDGCGVRLPPNGSPGGCRADANPGVDPEDNQLGSGRVADDSTASPVITPNGYVLYAAYTRYYYSQGHLMMFSPDGEYVGAYMAGWDSTPAIYRHGSTFSILLKENHYNIGSYCNDSVECPLRNDTSANDPEQYFITQLDQSLNVEWKFRSSNTKRCQWLPSGQLQCTDDHPHGFDWCVNAIAVDADGVAYANSADGFVYAIAQGGILRDDLFLGDAHGAAYSPIAIDNQGRIIVLNNGKLFIVTEAPRRRAVRR